MPSTILSDNGVSSGTAGIKTTGSNDGILGLQTTTAGGTATTAVTIDTSQNVGIGVTPSAWKSNYKAIQYGSYGSALYGRTDTAVAGVASNWYENSSGSDIYINNGYASRYQQASGAHSWLTAASGTAGNTISFTIAMTLNANGVLALQGASTSANGVGITFPATQSASTDANTLDDYEEGDWTPTVGAEISNPTGVSYSTRSGSYTKIGNVVYIRFRVNFSFTGGTGSGALEIGGLPFTSRTGISQPRSSPQQDNISYTGFTYLDMGTNANTTKVGIAKNRSGSTASGVLIGDCASGGTDINGGFFYFV
jgi:hypothetical protein